MVRPLYAYSKYPPAEPVALRLLAPQRGLFATVRSKSKNKSKNKNLVVLSSSPQHRQFEGEHVPGILKVLLPPRQSRGISLLDLACKLHVLNIGAEANHAFSDKFQQKIGHEPLGYGPDPSCQNGSDTAGRGSRGECGTDSAPAHGTYGLIVLSGAIIFCKQIGSRTRWAFGCRRFVAWIGSARSVTA